jgi:hypothetical protein
VTFCRYCGTAIAADSVFCAKCGKRLIHAENPRVEQIVRRLYLRTPYPYAALLILSVVVWAWAFIPTRPPTDYSGLTFNLVLDRKLDLPDENLFQQGFSLVMENAGSRSAENVRVELLARIEPAQPAEIVANFVGQRLLILAKGKPLPLTVELSDRVGPGTKRSYSMEGSVQAIPPFEVTYEIREENSGKILANYVLQR